jgi:sulfur-oxidizing protein SoxA
MDDVGKLSTPQRSTRRDTAWRVLLLLAVVITSLHAPAAGADTRRSTLLELSAATQALQRDDSQNPAMLWVKDGEAQWSRAPEGGPASKSCADCHGTLSGMRGVATRYPAHDNSAKRILNLGQRINFCRTSQQQRPAWAAEDSALLGLEAAIAIQSRGRPISPPAQPALEAARRQGEALFTSRLGQVGLSCLDCHGNLAGKRLGGTTLPQGHPTGYPIYRLEWQSVGSLNRRLRSCLTAVRADPASLSPDEMTSLEVYLMHRAKGMPLESPAVRP